MEASEHDLLIEIRGDVKRLLQCIDDHESRIRNIEKQHFTWLGRDGTIVAIISAGVSGLVALIAYLKGTI